MSRTLVAILGGALLVSALAYWWSRTNAQPETVIDIPWEPVNVAPSETPGSSSPTQTKTLAPVNDDGMPKTASESQMKFESADDTEDTDDSVTVEVEEE